MALLNFRFESQYLCCNTEIFMILPDRNAFVDARTFYESGRKYKVLWLLHGGKGDCSDWTRKTNIERYACEHDLIVVMPSAYNSSYANWDAYGRGLHMYDYLLEELMPMVYHWFPASDRREDNYIAGMSMGGQGTLKFVLNNPEKFASAAVISTGARSYPAFYDEAVRVNDTMFINLVKNAGGIEKFVTTKENMRYTMEQIAQKGSVDSLPPMYICCGEDDSHFCEFDSFRSFCQEKGYRFRFEAAPGYSHEWRYWDEAIQKALKFFDLDSEKTVNHCG